MVPPQASTHLYALADTLWYERRLLEFLLFKLVSANLVLTADNQRFAAPAVAEVARVMEEVRRAERERNAVVAEVARAWGVPIGDLSLTYIADNGPSELKADFEDHRASFLDLANEIEQLTRENRRLAAVGLEGIRGSLGLASSLTYDAAGRRDQREERPTHIDRVI